MIMIARGYGLDRAARLLAATPTTPPMNAKSCRWRWKTTTRAANPRGDELASCLRSLALNNLPEPQSHALQLAFFRGWTHQEIATRQRRTPRHSQSPNPSRPAQPSRNALKDYYV